MTPEQLDPGPFAAALAHACDAGDVAAVQLRLKNLGDGEILRAADILRPVAQKRGAAFLMNDRPDLAKASGCDGVHIGQKDASVHEARKILGDEATIGVTCHDSRHLAIEAAEAGCDYVAFGAFYPTKTKEALGHPTPEILQWWSEIMVVPCVAIGGITPENLAPLVKAGADFIAVCSGVWEHPLGAAAAVRAYNEAIARASS